jgi:Transposase
VARPTKLTPKAKERIIQSIRAGNHVEPACRAAGIAPSTFYSWLARGEREPAGIYGAFCEELRLAEAEAEVHAVALLRRAMPDDWRAALAYLERRHPDRWRRRTSTELTGKGGGPIQTDHRPAIDLTKLSDDELRILEDLHERASRTD